jgi:hypothetical protein
MIGNLGKLFKILIQRMNYMSKKKLFCCQFLLHRRNIFVYGAVLNVQRVILIKPENFGAFLSLCFRWENILTRDVLKEFYCV